MQIKVGIITFHRAQNYGAVLQCYALSNYLTTLGCDVEVIDYYPKVFREEYSSFPMTAFKKASFSEKMHTLVYYFRNLPYTKKRKKVFALFLQNYINLSSTQFDDANRMIGGYDVLFFGSDQVWNPKLTQGFDDVFTGNFKKGNTKFVSYAASTMMDSVEIDSEELTHAFQSILNRFDMVSVRERAFADYLNNLKIKNVVLVGDPVLLLNEEQWSRLAIRPNENRYLLLYSVPRSSIISNKAKDIAFEKGMKMIEIASNGRLYVNGMYKKIISPEEYVGFFQYADFIVSSSFHGTAFSVIFKKPFIHLLKGNSYDGRAYGLLEELHLTDRAITLDTNQVPPDDFWNKFFEDSYSKMKENSKNFINKALYQDL